MSKRKFIFVIGGVMSGVGKGIASASIGKILQARGLTVTAVKIDPYINVDAGTMNPIEHGEVYVTSDGDETDQDIGNYERFLDIDIHRDNYMTTGRVYRSVIEKERNLEYDGKCVEVVPHIPMEVIRRIKNAADKDNADVTIVEVGGTVGEYQNILFLEAARMMKLNHPEDVLSVLVSYLPVPSKIGEMKTKPTQTAAKMLNSAGIQPDFILCRADQLIDDLRKEKIAMFCNVRKEEIISAPDADLVYEIPANFERDGLSEKILKKLNLEARDIDLSSWDGFIQKIKNTKDSIKIGIVGKYFETGDFVLSDVYISVIESLKYAAWHAGLNPEIHWINSDIYDGNNEKIDELKNYQCLVVPGGFGSRGVEGKISAINYARENKIPFLGLCYGMQLASIEFARYVCGISGATTTEIRPEAEHPIIHIMSEQAEKLFKKQYGNTMRLGSYPCILKPGSIAERLYEQQEITERHRHRYEFNNDYRDLLEEAGLVFSGTSPDNQLVEIIELPEDIHPFFVATQFHPEFKSKPLKPHPLFIGLINAGMKRDIN